MSATVVTFGEWLPDQPDLGNPGLLTANNVEPVNGVYKSFATFQDTGGGVVLPGSEPFGVGIGIDISGGPYYYAVTDDGIFMSQNQATFNARSATLTAGTANFLQFKNLMIVTGQTSLLSHTTGSATNFSTLGSAAGTAPAASVIGRIGQFVFAGNTTEPVNGTVFYRLQWSGVGAPSSWPTPNSATATAQQAGEQFLDSVHGPVSGFANGDQLGIAFQNGAVTRITYVGPPVVFQFDKISDKIGCDFTKSVVQIGSIAYFVSRSGVYRTDGVTVQNLTENKCAEFLRLAIKNGNDDIYGAYHRFKKLIYWTYNDVSVARRATKMLVFNPEEGRFTTADYNAASAIYGTTGVENQQGQSTGFIFGFSLTNTLGSLSATAGSATITTGEVEINPGGRAFISGVKPNVQSTGTAPAITVRVGSRNDLGTTPSYTATTTPTTRTGFADFRVDAKYHRAEVQLVGNFDKIPSIEYKAFLTGES